MRNFVYISIFVILALFSAGCSYYNKMAKAFFPAPISELRAKLTFADFEGRAAGADSAIASDLRQMLIDSLLSSKRLAVLENRSVDADLIISAEVLEFTPQASGGRSGIGGGGGAASSAFGGLLNSSSAKANITLHIKIADNHSSQVLAAANIKGESKDITSPGRPLSEAGLKGVLATYANTPMGLAISECINDSSVYIRGAIPQKYYKY
jgi:hypothetical protein